METIVEIVLQNIFWQSHGGFVNTRDWYGGEMYACRERGADT